MGRSPRGERKELKRGHEVSLPNKCWFVFYLSGSPSLIRKGTSIRRTNETDMNAQSSRSHAIFSLTLTQKKYTGSGPPPRSSSPLPPSGRSPSRLARPSSTMYGGSPGNRVSSPTFGRPGTPSFGSAIGRGGSRPASSLGMLTADGGRRQSLAPGGPQTNGDDQGEWVTVVSKFHFVDLAGSERVSLDISSHRGCADAQQPFSSSVQLPRESVSRRVSRSTVVSSLLVMLSQPSVILQGPNHTPLPTSHIVTPSSHVFSKTRWVAMLTLS